MARLGTSRWSVTCQWHPRVTCQWHPRDKTHVPLLETLLDDATRCTSMRINNRNYETQVRDIALAALLHITKQDPRKFGFDRLQTHPQIVFNTTTVGFEDDTKRNEALAKWRSYRESQTNNE